MTSCVLLGLANSFEFIKEWSKEEADHYNKKMIEILDLNAPIVMPKEEIKQDNK